MRKLILFLKLCGVLLLVAIVLVALTGVALWLEWPAMTGVVIVAGLCGLLLCFWFLKKLFMWRNKKRFVAHILTQDTLTRPGEDLATLRPLRQAWEHGMAQLRRSPLRQQKNPVYALPWFLLLGERNSGKSSLLDLTGGVRPLGESLGSSGADDSFAQNKDDSLSWMFLPDAVILEANARYAGNLDASSDARDWEEFLTLLAAERSREPLNGTLLTISTDRLLHSTGVELSDMANNLRNRLMQITLTLGSRFPIYLLVTQIDTLPGMPELLARLPEKYREQTLGSFASPTAPLPMDLFVRETLAQAEQQLRGALADLAAHDQPPHGGDLRALAALRTLKDNLVLLLDVLFRRNPHQPALMMRGLFLTSVLSVETLCTDAQMPQAFMTAEQASPYRAAADAASRMGSGAMPVAATGATGEAAAPLALNGPVAMVEGIVSAATAAPEALAASAASAAPGSVTSGTATPGTARSGTAISGAPDMAAVRAASSLRKTSRLIPCFFGELFFRILPGDRGLHRPLEGLWAMKSRVVGMGYAAWYLLTFCLCGLFALNTLYNWHVLHADVREADTAPNLSAQVYTLYNQNNQIRVLKHAQAIWWLPTFGLNRIGELEQRRIAAFESIFFNKELLPFFQDINQRIQVQGRDRGQKDEYRFHLLQRLMWMSKALELRRTTGTADDALKLPFPVFMDAEHTKTAQELVWNPTFGNYFITFLNRASNETLDMLTAELEKTTLHTLGSRGVRDFSWLISGINKSPQLATIYLEIFLPHRAVPTADSISIPPVYTAMGYQEIDMFIDGLLTVTRHNPEIVTATDTFWKRYHRDYAQAWNAFGFKADSIWDDEFRNEALEDLVFMSSIRDTAQVQLLARMGKELEPLVQAKAAPKWVSNVVLANAMLELTSARWEAHPGSGEMSSLSMLLSSVSNTNNPIWSLLSADMLDLAGLRSFFNATAGLYAYYDNLRRLSNTLANPEAAFQLVQAHYGGSQYGKIDESPYTLATKSLEAALGKLPQVEADKDVARFVLTSQLRFMAHALIVRAAKSLDDMWVANVVAPGQMVQRGGAIQDELGALFGEKGLVTSFVNSQAKAFLTRDRAGYHAASLKGLTFPFTEDFLAYIQDGQAGALAPPQDSYVVTLHSDPTSVNLNAVEKPQSTIFALACQGAPLSLQNDNYPKLLKITYKPKECGPASLSIRFPSLTLTRNYPDFPAFLSEFLYGEQVFVPQDFPEQAEGLTALGVREIMVRLLPDNAVPVLAGQNASVPVMPERITFSR